MFENMEGKNLEKFRRFLSPKKKKWSYSNGVLTELARKKKKWKRKEKVMGIDITT